MESRDHEPQAPAKQPTTADANAVDDAVRVLYEERQWVPWHWWVFGAIAVAVITAQLALNRSALWLYLPGLFFAVLGVWILLSLSSTRIRVELDADGTRWLVAGEGNLPHTVVTRSLAVPKSAKRAAMGRQYDPATFAVSHDWVDEMALFVIEDPEDPTPYWLISTKDPEALLTAFVPDQAEQALKPLQKETK